MQMVKIFVATSIVLGGIASPSAAVSISSPIGRAMRACISEATFTKEGIGSGDERFNVIQMVCRDDAAKQFWIELGRMHMITEADTVSTTGNKGRVRSIGKGSYCVHWAEEANGDPMDQFHCSLSISLDDRVVDAF